MVKDGKLGKHGQKIEGVTPTEWSKDYIDYNRDEPKPPGPAEVIPPIASTPEIPLEASIAATTEDESKKDKSGRGNLNSMNQQKQKRPKASTKLQRRSVRRKRRKRQKKLASMSLTQSRKKRGAKGRD